MKYIVETAFGALVLAGGDARRMGGRSKALLLLEQRSFLARLEGSFSSFSEKLLSANSPDLADGTAFTVVADRIPHRGPLEGLAAALTICRSDALVVVACDMPLFPKELASALINALGERDAVVCRDREGGLHPLCGVYRKTCLPVMDAMLASGDFRVRKVLERVSSGEFLLAGTPFPDRVLTNINTPEELAQLRKT